MKNVTVSLPRTRTVKRTDGIEMTIDGKVYVVGPGESVTVTAEVGETIAAHHADVVVSEAQEIKAPKKKK